MSSDEWFEDDSAIGPMSGAELKVVMGWLGLSQRDLAAIVGVSERSVRRWTDGESPIPEGVRGQVESIEAFTAEVVGELVEALEGMRDPAVGVYRASADMWLERPEFEPYPASWWRQVVARAVSEVPGVEIGYVE